MRDHCHTVRATSEDGRRTARWPNGEPDGLITGTITLTLDDGTTRQLTGDSLMNSPSPTPRP